MTGFDIIVLLIVGATAVVGFLRGFVQEVLSLAAWFAAVLAIRLLHQPFTDFLLDRVGTPSGAAVLAFVLLLLVPYGLVRLVAGWAGRNSRRSVLGPVDRVLGFGFGVVKGVIIVVMAFSIVVLGYDTVWGPGGRPAWMVTARTYPFVNASSEALVKIVAERQARLRQEQPVDPAT